MEKNLKELTLLDKFLFDQTMDIPEAHEAVLQIIFGDDVIISRLLIPRCWSLELSISMR